MNSEQILIVDDSANNRFALQQKIEHMGWQTQLASSGEEALLQLMKHPIDLILLDVQMAGMDGFETAARIRYNRKDTNIPIIFVTAVYKNDEFVDRGFQLGAWDYLPKPINSELLFNKIELFLKLNQQHLQLQALNAQLVAAQEGLEDKVAQRTAELRSSQAALLQAKDKADASNMAKSQFLSHMSHELRSPLNVIIGFAEVLTKPGDQTLDKSTSNTYINNIKMAGQHLLGVIGNVLDISKIEEGGLVVEKSTLNLVELLASVQQLGLAQAHQKGLEFGLKTDPGLPQWVVGDPVRLLQVLVNLVDNAIKFTPRGQVEVVARQAADSRIEFCVTDTGIGIADAELERLYQPFEQLNASTAKEYGGSGLGLNITKQLVQALGGTLELNSKVGHGSCFCFALNLPQTSPQQPFAAVVPEVENRPMQLLLVEDVEVNARLVQAMLQPLGHKVVHVTSGEDAIAAVKKHSFDLVFMDLHMPGMDGLLACRKIRQLKDAAKAKVPVVALSADVLLESQLHAKQAGMNGFVSKPFKLDDLLANFDLIQ